MGIYVGLGANLDSLIGPPRATLERALGCFPAHGLEVKAQSRWYASDAIPDPGDPRFTNGVVEIETGLTPGAVLKELHAIERVFGRVRDRRWAPRVLDLDLLDFNGLTNREGASDRPDLPHPHLHRRAFVLFPLRDIAPEWRHPVLRKSVDQLIRELPEPLDITPL